MKNSKVRKYFGRGRKWVFTHASKSQGIKVWLLKRGAALALFLLVFAAASVVKIHAGTSDSGQGWLWGGGAGPNDGTNTNVGWISINNTNQGGAVNYGVNIPSGTGDVSGYAWSENIGWISFNAADLAGCPQGQCKANVSGNNFKGWARILGIKDALSAGNSGGWQGWISLSGAQYGVKINADNTLTGFGWSDELGWIDFSRAKVAMACSLAFVPGTKTMNESSSDKVSLQEVGSSCSCNNVKVASTNAAVVDGISPTAVNFSAPTMDSSDISFNTKSVTSTATFNGIVQATSDNCGATALNLIVQNVPDCHIACPDSIQVAPGGAAENIDISSSGTECGGLAVSSCNGSAGNITVGGPTGGNCTASATSAATFKDSATAIVSTNVGSCSTKVFVKRLGWIETNP
ncbi:MAG: hypothetical protein NT170_03975 [Candidatus Moranbacteria bacterium]|nr:hypothetical protein [Candidatus Moranbacteria bacterium]